MSSPQLSRGATAATSSSLMFATATSASGSASTRASTRLKSSSKPFAAAFARAASLGFLETLRKQGQHLRPGGLGRFAVDGDGDAPQADQRNALFSFSKNPSSAR